MPKNNPIPAEANGKNAIIIRKALQHNLCGFDLAIPKHKLIVFTGPSGSGKSSLAFDTLYAEGQRRYLDAMSSYARMFIPQSAKPNVEQLLGLSPTISIEQKTGSTNQRSTVGTVTEVYDYIRVLYAELGQQHCYKCKKPVDTSTPQRIVKSISTYPTTTRVIILAPLIRNRKGEHREIFTRLLKDGFSRVRVDGEITQITEVEELHRQKKHDIEVVIDRLILKDDPDTLTRLSDSIDRALLYGKNELIALITPPSTTKQKPIESLFSVNKVCQTCNISFPELSHQSFTFNSKIGWCPTCKGTGINQVLSEEALIGDPSTSIAEGVIVALGSHPERRGGKSHPLRKEMAPIWQVLLKDEKFALYIDEPWESLPKQIKTQILHHIKNEKINKSIVEIMHHLHKLNLREHLTAAQATLINDFYEDVACKTCKGARLRKESQNVYFHNISINDVNSLQIDELREKFALIQLTQREFEIGNELFKEIKTRL